MGTSAHTSLLNPWPARWPTGSRPNVARYPLAASQTFNAGALVVLDASEDVTECGADPASILGVATVPAEHVIESGYIEVYVADNVTVFAMKGTSNPAKANINQSYGVVKDGTSNRWEVDLTDTTNTRVKVVDIDTTRNLFFVTFLVANRQLG